MSTYPDLLEGGKAEQRSLIRLERSETRAILTLSDPGRLNSLIAGLVHQLHARLTELAADPGLRSIVITGEDPAFSAGGDLEMIETGSKAIRELTEPADTTDAWRWIRRQFGGVVRTIAGTDKAFIAAVNGALSCARGVRREQLFLDRDPVKRSGRHQDWGGLNRCPGAASASVATSNGAPAPCICTTCRRRPPPRARTSARSPATFR